MTSFPIAASDPLRGNSAAGHDRPTPVAGRVSHLFRPVARRLGITPTQAMVLVTCANEVRDTDLQASVCEMSRETLKVHVHALRRKGWTVISRHNLGYKLAAADRQRVVDACSPAPPGVLPSLGVSSLDFAGASAPAPFQSEQDATGKRITRTRANHP
jgi:hypothetical protein